MKMNPRVLVTQWPPPSSLNNHSKEWNPERFQVWMNYIMKEHNMRNVDFDNLGMNEWTLISMKKAKHKPRTKTLVQFVECIMEMNPKGRTRGGLLREARQNMRLYKTP